LQGRIRAGEEHGAGLRLHRRIAHSAAATSREREK
jgi:hypothetical protein